MSTRLIAGDKDSIEMAVGYEQRRGFNRYSNEKLREFDIHADISRQSLYEKTFKILAQNEGHALLLAEIKVDEESMSFDHLCDEEDKYSFTIIE